MRLAELTDTYLTVEFADEDLAELVEEFSIALLGRFVRIPGCQLNDAFYARAGEMRAASRIAGPFYVLDAHEETTCLIAEEVCAHWPGFGVDGAIYFYGVDGELWCRNERGFSIEVAAPRSTAVLWLLLAAMIGVAEVVLTVALAWFEGVRGALFINIMLVPFLIVCIARALYCWRFRVTASLRGITVQPVFGTTWSVALSDIERVERTVDRRAGGAVRRLVIGTDAGKVTMRDALAGIDELDAFLITYGTGKKGSLA